MRISRARRRRAESAGRRAHAATLRGAAESALGKTPARVSCATLRSFRSGRVAKALWRAPLGRRGARRDAETQALARRAGLCTSTTFSVPRLRSSRRGVLPGPQGAVRAGTQRSARKSLFPNKSLRRRERRRVFVERRRVFVGGDCVARKAAPRSPRRPRTKNSTRTSVRERNIPASNDGPFGPFVPPTPTYLDDVAAVVSRPAVAARVDLTGDGYDRARFAWGGGGTPSSRFPVRASLAARRRL